MRWHREREAGQSAEQIYKNALRAWRRAVRLELLGVAVFVSLGALPVWLYFPHGAFFAGLWLGVVFGMLQWIWEDPPHFIERWKIGAEGERRTAKELRQLRAAGWSVRHDLANGSFGNLDHVVQGPGGVFLL